MRLVDVIRAAWLLLLLLAGEATADGALYERGLLWQVEREGGVASHLLGTLHSDAPRVVALPPLVRQALNHSRRYVMEVKLGPDLGLATSMMGAMLLGEGESLDRLMPAEPYARLVALGRELGMPESTLKRMKPWAVATTLSLPKSSGGEILDLKLQRIADKLGLPSYGLERVEEQLDIFDGLPLEDQLALLIDTVDNHQRIQQELLRLTDLYLARDLAAIWALQAQSLGEGDELLNRRLIERLIDVRNHRMVERMLPHLEAGRAFIAIGALHLPGEEGVLNLLKQQGYRVSVVY